MYIPRTYYGYQYRDKLITIMVKCYYYDCYYKSLTANVMTTKLKLIKLRV